MHCTLRTNWTLMVAFLGLFLSGCNGNGAGGLAGTGPGLPLANQLRPGPAQAPLRRGRHHVASGKIRHVVIIIQENRSLNDLFMGYPGATTQSYGYISTGQKVSLTPVVLEAPWELENNLADFLNSCNGTGSIPGTDCQMNGFNKESVTCGGPSEPACPSKYPEYGFVPRDETKPYWAIAEQYVLADQMYASNLDESSFISHQYIIAAQAESAANYPNGDWGCVGGYGDTIAKIGPDREWPYGKRESVCFNDMSLGQEADSAGVTWASYSSPVAASVKGSGIWQGYQANHYVYDGSDWKNDIITPQTRFFTDVSNGNLRQISWITPTCANSDHAGCDSNTGPAWVASLVNAIGKSKYWDNTAIFIFWDDPGGWYDPEPPAYVDYDGLGMRIPMLIVSAYAKKGHVSHVHYEHGTILKFIENLFGLPAMAASDTRANPPDDAFQFDKPPRPFTVIPSAHGKEYFMHQPIDPRPPDTQ
jgi:phospholipase C